MFRITKTWIHAHKTPAGGWKRAQLARIGVAWPPMHGWIDRVVGTEISEADRLAFEAYSARVFAPVWSES